MAAVVYSTIEESNNKNINFLSQKTRSTKRGVGKLTKSESHFTIAARLQRDEGK
jgi:hypothetical protein